MDTKHHFPAGIAACVLLFSAGAQAEVATPRGDALDYQERLLLHPTPGQLAAEADGRIHIYDSIKMALVDEALDQHFERMESMMFIRIHHLPSSGAGPAVVENDGCD